MSTRRQISFAFLRVALTAPSRRERTVLVVLAVYWMVWTAYGTVSKAPQGLHADMTEIIAWSRDLALGYLKHPPLAAWLAAGWFAVFPVAEWSYYGLAMLMPVAALWIAWRLMADYLDAEKRVIGLTMLTLVPFFNFHALKYNVNTVLMPLWAITSLWFLRSYRACSPGYATLAGLAAALAMYGKYWSIFLVVGLAAAALLDRRRAAYFRSLAPWLTVTVGLVAMAPHLWWLVDSHFAPFSYAMSIHGEKSLAVAATSALGYLGGALGYVAMPLAIVLVISRRPAVLVDAAWPHDDDRRLAAAAFWAPLLLPVVAAIAGKTEITSLWSMSAWTLLPVLILSPPALSFRSVDIERLLGLAVAVPLVMLIASPGIAWLTRYKAQRAEANSKALATAIDQVWHSLTSKPLRFVGGDPSLIDGIVTWNVDQPKRLGSTIAPNERGIVFACYRADVHCVETSLKAVKRISGGPPPLETSIAVGEHSLRNEYAIIAVPP